MLKMKTVCEGCKESFNEQSLAYICSYECTFCKCCSEKMKFICPNCEGELVVRPRRLYSPTQVIARRSRRWLGFGSEKE